MMQRWSLLTLFLLSLFFTGMVVKHKPQNILSWDVYGHYLYLPAAFINHDLGMKDFEKVQEKVEEYQSLPTFYVAYDTEKGNKLIKYPLGFSVLMSPFFFTADVFCQFSDYERDGFSEPYQWAIVLGCLFYVLLGLFFLRKLLLLYFSDPITSILLLLLAFGTNYYFMVIHAQGMNHGVLFAFYAMLIYYTAIWHKKPTKSIAIKLGLVIGLLCLTRASELLAVLIPILWNVKNLSTLKEKIHFFKQHKSSLFISAGIIVLCGLPQLFYWKFAAGSFVLDPYQNPGEGFDWFAPHTLEFLFSYRKGWWIYTPVMMVYGFGFWLAQKKHAEASSLFLFSILNIYLLSSWTCWWYGGSFGQRSIIQSYPVYLLGLGFLIQYVYQVRWKAVMASVFLVCFGALNIFQSWQVTHDLIDSSRMTREAYWSTFLKTEKPKGYYDLLLIDPMRDPETLISQTDKFIPRVVWQSEKEAPESLRIMAASSENIYSEAMNIPWESFNCDQYAIFEITASFKVFGDPSQVRPALACKFQHSGKTYFEKYIEPGLGEFPEETWEKQRILFIAPYIRKKKDELQLFAWLMGEGSFQVKDIEVKIYERK